jgi:hypothetical protein
LKREEEEQLLESLGRVEAYRPVFQQYAGYENRVLPGTITALGEIDTSEVRSLPSKNILMVGVQDRVFAELWRGFREPASFNLLTPLSGDNFDLWVIAVPMHRLQRLTWVVFPVTDADAAEISKEPKFSVIIVPVEKQDFGELVDRVEAVLDSLIEGGVFPSEQGIILLMDLSEVYGGR